MIILDLNKRKCRTSFHRTTESWGKLPPVDEALNTDFTETNGEIPIGIRKAGISASLDKKTFWCLTLRLIYIWGIMIDRSGQFVLIICSLFAEMGLQNMGYVQAILWDVLMGFISTHTPASHKSAFQTNFTVS